MIYSGDEDECSESRYSDQCYYDYSDALEPSVDEDVFDSTSDGENWSQPPLVRAFVWLTANGEANNKVKRNMLKWNYIQSREDKKNNVTLGQAIINSAVEPTL